MDSKAGVSERQKRVEFAILAILLGIVVAVGSAELACRILHGDRYRDLSNNPFPPGSVIYDPDIGWAYRPGYEGQWGCFEYRNQVKINAVGLRDEEIGPKTRPRILFIGDSFVFGFGVELEDTFVKGVGRRLASEGIAVDCINGGRIGSGSQVYLHYARKFVPLVQPDLVVLCPYCENDVLDTWTFKTRPADTFENRGGEVYMRGLPLARERHAYGGPLFDRSALYRYLRIKLARMSIHDDNDEWRKGEWLDHYALDPPGYILCGEMLMLGHFDEIDAFCSEENIPFAVVLIPSIVDSNPKLWKKTLKLTNRRAEEYDRRRPYRVVEEHARLRGWTLLNLMPAVESSRKPLYYRHDRHFNAAGNRLAAAEIADFLLSQPSLVSALRDRKTTGSAKAAQVRDAAKKQEAASAKP
jgi:lysophospholipase L1-like esterase